MIYRFILADWAKTDGKADAFDRYDVSDEELLRLNAQGYNCYYLPNDTIDVISGRAVQGSDINVFQFVYADMDLKEGKHKSKDDFLREVAKFSLPPTFIVDSGNGIHVYWNVTDLDAMSFLRFQRRICRLFLTDVAVAKIYQLMRVPGTTNVKSKDKPKDCVVLAQTGASYTSEQLHKALPPILPKDEDYCLNHYRKTYEITEADIESQSQVIPEKFHKIMKTSDEVKNLFLGNVKDRSAGDFRLAHLLRSYGLTQDEARAVLMNCKKASERSPVHRYNYADNIVEKVYDANTLEEADEGRKQLSIPSVRDIIAAAQASGEDVAPKFPCFKHFDGTEHGFRLTEVMGLIGGSGAGKTTVAMNFFGGFVIENMGKNYVHLFVSLEQPKEEIAARWIKFSNGDALLQDSVYILDNFEEDGSFRNLSLTDIMAHVLELEKATGKKVGCVTIDHIGVLNHGSKFGDTDGLMGICKDMKNFAKGTKTFLIMQSQTSREKAGIGDIELDKDAAYGTTKFEWYCDYVVTTWQPLKRIYPEKPHMTVTAYKFCKVRKQNVLRDTIKVDEPRALMFEPDSERLRELTGAEAMQFKMCQTQVINIRKRDRKTEPAPIRLLTKKESNAAS